MKTILVDDMLLDLQLFELKCADMPDFEIVGKFTDPNAAIEYAAGQPVHFRSGKAKELMALCVYRDGRPVSIHEIVENLWGENADGTGYRRTIKELADTLRDYGAEEMFLRSRGSLRVRMDLADSDFQAFMSGDEDAICQFQGVFMQQYSWAEPMVCTLQEKKELMLARMGKHRM